MCVQLLSAPNESICIHQHTHTNKGTHTVFMRQHWHSALRRRHTSQAQRKEGNPDGGKKEKDKCKKKKKREKEVKIRTEEETNAADGRTTEKIKGKPDKACLVSDPHHTDRDGEMLLLIATGSTCLSSASACLSHIFIVLCTLCVVQGWWLYLSVCLWWSESACLTVCACIPVLSLTFFSASFVVFHGCTDGLTSMSDSTARQQPQSIKSAEKTDTAAAGARQSGMLGAHEV